MKKKTIALMLLSAIVLTTGCGSSGSKYATQDATYSNGVSYDSVAEEAYAYDDYAYEDYEFADEAMTAYSEASGSSSVTTSENASTSNRKLIRNVSLDVETKDFDSLTKNLYESISNNGGYIESMNVYNGSSYNSYRDTRNASITARIPAKNLDTFVNTIGEAANITSRSESVDDVTLSYVDMTSHRDMLKEEQERLLEFLSEATTVEEIITLEDRLTNVKYQLESMESQIRTYDNQVDYSTVRIQVNEVKEYTPEPVETKTTSQRISEGFKESLEDIKEGFTEFFIGFVVNLPYIILFLVFAAIVAVIIIVVIKANDKATAKRKLKRAEAAKNAKETESNKVTDNDGETESETTAKAKEASSQDASTYVNKPAK